mgnify:CR=1 FL=1
MRFISYGASPKLSITHIGRGRTSLDQLRVLGPGRGEGRSFRKKIAGRSGGCQRPALGHSERCPIGHRQEFRRPPRPHQFGSCSAARAWLPHNWCVAATPWVRGSRAPAKRLPRAPLSGRQQPGWQPAASAWLPALQGVAASPGAAKPRLATACRRPTRPFCLQMGGRAVVVASSPALTVES